MGGLLSIDPTSFMAVFGGNSILIRHSLVDHPLFTIDAMAALADELPANSVGRQRADVQAFVGGKPEDVGGGSPSETIRDIENNRCRVALRDIQQVPRYAELINSCLDEVAILVAGREGGMRKRSGYLFISPSQAVTPVHFDAEHSFLLQIRGTKHVSVSPIKDPTVRWRELDRYSDHKQLDSDALVSEVATLTMGPGEGVYIPPFIPHWVETEAGLSVSFSIPFYTAMTERTEFVNQFNNHLRQAHMSPRPPGQSRGIDYAKALAYRSGSMLNRIRKRK